MEAYLYYLNELINKNKLEYNSSSGIRWLNQYQASEYVDIRENLLKNVGLLFKGTKPFYKRISDGCKICGEGKWSCLFINGKCNANCFYCPTEQNNIDLPQTQSLTFESAKDYALYINHFDFKGVSFSGGEPLLNLNKCLDFSKSIRQLCNLDLYIWLYTNGLLVNDQKLEKLSEFNINEIRFDIGATNYNIKYLKNAYKYIKNITIEIPCIPEEKERLIELLPQLIDFGVTNLNLHQLRLTQYNKNKIIPRNYTIIPSERPIVMESEIVALEILNYAKENKLDIGINYCSFDFKNRFQKSGFRKQILKKYPNNGTITENGYLRTLNDSLLNYEQIILDQNQINTNIEELIIGTKQYYFNQYNMLTIDLKNNFLTNDINNIIKNEPEEIPNDETLFKIWNLEYIEKDLRKY